MVWISRLIAALLVSIITIAVLAQIFDSTLLNSKYLTTTANKSGVYSALSVNISNQLLKELSQQNNSGSNITPAQASTIVRSVITASLIQSKINGALSEIQAYYKGTGPQPTISLADVITKLQAAGLPITNNNTTLTKPIVIQSNDKVKQEVKNFEEVKLISTIAAVVLFGLLIFLSWEEHRWKVVPDLLIIVGVYLGVIATVFILAVPIADKVGKLNTNTNDFVNTAQIYAKSLTRGVGEYIGIVAVVLLVVGIVFRVMLHNIDKNKKPSKPQKANSNLKLKSA